MNPWPRRRRQRGIAAIELAAIVSLTFFLVPLVLMLGMATLQYSALQKAVYDAARYMGTLPAAEMTTTVLASQAANAARRMVADAARDAGLLARPDAAEVAVLCNVSNLCSGPVLPQSVTVKVTVYLSLSDFSGLFYDVLPSTEMAISAQATVPYGD